MHVRIYSHFTGEAWEDDVPTMDLEGVFRFFNRVELEDAVRLREVGYTLPSLSCGDLVTIEGFVYSVDPAGWSRLESAEVV